MRKSYIDKLAYIYIKDKNVLVTLSKGKNTWYIPGGKREENESDKEALIREVKEELTVDIVKKTIKPYGVFEDQAHEKPKGTIVRMTCYTAAFSGELKPNAEIDKLNFFSYSQVDQTAPVDHLIFEDLKGKGLIKFTGKSKLFGIEGKVDLARKGKGFFIEEDMEIILKEYEAQIDYFHKKMKKLPTHLDHHHNLQDIPGYKDKYFEFVIKLGLPVRTRLLNDARSRNIVTAHAISKEFFNEEDLNYKHLAKILKSLSEDVTELVAHPSLKTGETLDSYTEIPRYKQVQVLTDKRLISLIKELDIQLTTYDQL